MTKNKCIDKSKHPIPAAIFDLGHKYIIFQNFCRKMKDAQQNMQKSKDDLSMLILHDTLFSQPTTAAIINSARKVRTIKDAHRLGRMVTDAATLLDNIKSFESESNEVI